MFFFFKQKTAYEMRISDWSSDVCSSDLKAEWSKVIIKPIPSAPARVAALLAGDVDMIDNVPTTDVANLKKNPKVALSSGISNRIIYLHMDQFRDQRSEESRGGKELFSMFRSRWSTYH